MLENDNAKDLRESLRQTREEFNKRITEIYRRFVQEWRESQLGRDSNKDDSTGV